MISQPVLTGSTHKPSQSHVQPSPKPASKPLPLVPPKAASAGSSLPQESIESEQNLKLPTKAEPKSRFGPIFKKPNIGKPQETASPKLAEKKQDNPEPDVVRKRELTREISNPVLISTTDRRSKHLVKLDNILVNNGENDSGGPIPPVPPPKISLNRSESDQTKKNKPLPPRPLSMPTSESGEEVEMTVKESRKSMNIPQRPPPPPYNKAVLNDDPPPSYDSVKDTRQTIEDEISKLDDIQVEIPKADKSKNIKPSTVNKSTAKKPLQPKPVVKKSTSDSSKKPLVVSKKPATQSKSDPKQNKGQWAPVEKPIFNPKDRPGVSKKTSRTPAAKTDQSESSVNSQSKTRTDSTDSLDDDAATSVYARKKMFEGQKKPLLGAKSNPESTVSAPQTPPKPGGKTGKQIRSVNV